MKFGQLTEYNTRKIFFKKSTKHLVEKLLLDYPLYKRSKLHISLH